MDRLHKVSAREGLSKSYQRDVLAILPLEMLQSIMEYLPTESAVALAFTCQRLYDQVLDIMSYSNAIDVLDATDWSRHRFMQLLERDDPRKLHCQSCNRLYVWQTRSGEYTYTSIECSGIEKGCCGRKLRLALCLCECPRAQHISMREVRDLVLRADEMGPEYGLPVTVYNHTCVQEEPDDLGETEGCGDSRLKTKTWREARVRHGKIILKTRLEGGIRTAVSYDAQSRIFDHVLCPHLRTFSEYPISNDEDSPLSGLLRSKFDAVAFGASDRYKSGIMHCYYCATDFKVSFSSRKNNIIDFTVTGWQMLYNRASSEHAAVNGSTLWRFWEDTTRPLPLNEVQERDLESLYDR